MLLLVIGGLRPKCVSAAVQLFVSNCLHICILYEALSDVLSMVFLYGWAHPGLNLAVVSTVDYFHFSTGRWRAQGGATRDRKPAPSPGLCTLRGPSSDEVTAGSPQGKLQDGRASLALWLLPVPRLAASANGRNS